MFFCNNSYWVASVRNTRVYKGLSWVPLPCTPSLQIVLPLPCTSLSSAVNEPMLPSPQESCFQLSFLSLWKKRTSPLQLPRHWPASTPSSSAPLSLLMPWQLHPPPFVSTVFLPPMMNETAPCRSGSTATLLTTPLQPQWLPHAMPSQLLIFVTCSLACQ